MRTLGAIVAILQFSVRDPAMQQHLGDVQTHMATNLGSFKLYTHPVCNRTSSYHVECSVHGEQRICENLRATMTDSLTLSQVFGFHVDDFKVLCKLHPLRMDKYREWLREEEQQIEWLQKQHQ